MKRKEGDEGECENQPAGKLVEKALCNFGTEIMRAHTRPCHAESIRNDSNGDCRRGDQRSDPGSGIRKVSVDDAEREQRYERANPAARLSHLQTRIGKVNDIALAQDRDASYQQ